MGAHGSSAEGKKGVENLNKGSKRAKNEKGNEKGGNINKKMNDIGDAKNTSEVIPADNIGIQKDETSQNQNQRVATKKKNNKKKSKNNKDNSGNNKNDNNDTDNKDKNDTDNK